MALIKFTANWSKDWQKQTPKGFLLIKPKEAYHKKIAIVLNKLDQMQQKKEELKDIDITIEVHYRKRTILQNNTMFALYTIEANEINGGLKGNKSQMVTPEELYEQDLKDYAPRTIIKIIPEQYNYYKSKYRVIEKEKKIEYEKNDIKLFYYELKVIESSSHWNTLQMAQHLDMLFNRIASNGVSVTNPSEIYKYWVEYRQALNDNKIVLHDDVLTGAEYRTLNPICEATGDFIGDGSGQLCHIKARGMGGNPEAEKDYASNWLHLTHEAHIETQHQKGWQHFLKVYPHLTYKVSTALRREYPTTEDSSTADTVKELFEGEEVKEGINAKQ